MVKEISGRSRWSLTLFRSGGYEKNNELRDALFSFGRTKEEVLQNCHKLRLPNGIIHLISRFGLSEEVLESGFIIDISIKKVSATKSERWCNFTKIISSSERVNHHCLQRESSVYSTDYGFECFEMIEVSPESEKMPNRVWVRVSPLNDQSLAWAISQNNILSCDDKEQKTLHDFSDINISEPIDQCIRLPGPPASDYNFLN